MKVLLLSQYKQLEIADLPEPKPGPGEVLIRVAACGICGSDVHGYDGSSGRRIPPIVMGHEASGRIAAVGGGVRAVLGGAGGGFRKVTESLSTRPSTAVPASTAFAAKSICATGDKCWAFPVRN